MSSTYYYGEAYFQNEEAAKKTVEHIDYVAISKKWKTDDVDCTTDLPSMFLEDAKSLVSFDLCEFKENTFMFEVQGESFESIDSLREFSYFLAGRGVKECVIASYYSGGDFNPDIYLMRAGLIQHVYAYGDNENIDKKIINDDGDLKLVVNNIKTLDIQFRQDELSPEEAACSDLIASLNHLLVPVLFDDTPYGDLGLDNLFVNLARDKVKELLKNLNEDEQSKVQNYISLIFESGINSALRMISRAGYDIYKDNMNVTKGQSIMATH